MKKIFPALLILFCLFTVFSIGIAYYFGGGSVLRLTPLLFKPDDRLGVRLWNNYISKGDIRNGVMSFNGFWGKRIENEVWVWTVSGLKSYDLSPETGYIFTDVCSLEARQNGVLYGSVDTKSVKIDLQEWEKHVRSGMSVGLLVDAETSKLVEMSFTNVDFYRLWTSQPFVDLCN